MTAIGATRSTGHPCIVHHDAHVAKATRVDRFAALPDLKRAVRAWCVAEVNRRAGCDWWCEAQESYLRESIPSPTKLEAAEVLGALRDALERAADFAREHAEIDTTDAEGIRRLLDVADRWLPRGRRASWPKRYYAIADFDHPGIWWWTKGRKPTNRDLAILSLLAGNFPDGPRRAIREFNAHGGSVLGLPSVLDVVRSEERAIALVRRHLNPHR